MIDKSRADIERVVANYKPARSVNDSIKAFSTDKEPKEATTASLFAIPEQIGRSRCDCDLKGAQIESPPKASEIKQIMTKFSFAAGEEFVSLFREVQALMSSKCPRGAKLEDIFKATMRIRI